MLVKVGNSKWLITFTVITELVAWIWSNHLCLQWKFKLFVGEFATCVCLRCKGETLLGVVNELFFSKVQTFCFQKFVDNPQQCFAFTPQANFPAHNLNFHSRWRWWDGIQDILLNLFYFTCMRNKISKTLWLHCAL
jgi:hypothetical protein